MKLLLLKTIVLAGLILLGEGASAETCKMQKKAELALGYANGMATAEAKINGTAVIMGLDTGAQTLVTPQTAEELRLMAGMNRTLMRGTTAVTVAGQVIFRDFEFAGTHYGWKAVTKIKLPTPKVPDLKAKPVAGLIGMDILGDYDLDFDFPRRKLTLYSVKGCAAVPPSDFADIRAIPFKLNSQRSILFPVEVDGKKITAFLDTGAVLHLITPAGIKKVGVTEAALKSDPQTESIGAGNISLKHPLHTFSKLTIGGVEHSDAKFGVLARSLGQGDALIGQVYLFTRRIRISNAARTLYVENKQTASPYSIQALNTPLPVPLTLGNNGGNKPFTLEEVCKGAAALRLNDFCEKGAGVPAAALGGPLGVPAAPAGHAVPAAGSTVPPQPSQQASNAPPPVSPGTPASAQSPAQPAAAPAPGEVNALGLLKPQSLEEFCRRTNIPQVREICGSGPQTVKPAQQTSLTPPSAPAERRWHEPQMFAFGFIGTGVLGITSGCGVAMGVRGGAGVLVRGFTTGSAGEKAGLRRGDIIVALDGQPVANAAPFLDAIRKTPPGQKLKLAVWRDKAETVLEAESADFRTQPPDSLTPDGRAAYQAEAGEAVLAMLPEGACGLERAVSLVFLGGALGRRAETSGAAEHRERAIEYLERGLAGLDAAKSPIIWATGQTQLGTAYRLRTAGQKGANIERAIRAYEEAILVRDAYVARDERGSALIGLGLALLNRDSGKRSENVERAIGCFDLAKQAFDSKVKMKDWADLHRALARAYLDRGEGERARNIDAAIAALEVATGAYNHGVGEAGEKAAVQAQLIQLRAGRLSAPSRN